MLNISEVRGAIFDLDDTLLDNGPVNHPELWLHSRSRLAAIHQVAERHGLTRLADLTPEENGRAFTTAKVHSLPGAIWNGMYMKGVVPSDTIDVDHPYYSYVAEIVARKNELHGPILREFGAPEPGSVEFVHDLASYGLTEELAMATMAVRRDIDLYLDMTRLGRLFPDERIVSNEKITEPKPAPQSFELAFQTLGLPDSARRYTLAFEDDPRGLLSAKKTGLFIIAMTFRYKRDDIRLLEVEPDYVADSYDEVRDMLGMNPAGTSVSA